MARRKVKQLKKYVSSREEVEQELEERNAINVNSPATKRMIKDWRTKSVQEAIKDAETIKKMFYEEGKGVSEIAKSLHIRPDYINIILTKFYREQPHLGEGGLVPPVKAYEATARHLLGENPTRISKRIKVRSTIVTQLIEELQDFAVSNPNEFIKEYKRLLLKAGTDKKEVEEKVKKLKKALAQF